MVRAHSGHDMSCEASATDGCACNDRNAREICDDDCYGCRFTVLALRIKLWEKAAQFVALHKAGKLPKSFKYGARAAWYEGLRS